jgi:hypothetical protein
MYLKYIRKSMLESTDAHIVSFIPVVRGMSLGIPS